MEPSQSSTANGLALGLRNTPYQCRHSNVHQLITGIPRVWSGQLFHVETAEDRESDRHGGSNFPRLCRTYKSLEWVPSDSQFRGWAVVSTRSQSPLTVGEKSASEVYNPEAKEGWYGINEKDQPRHSTFDYWGLSLELLLPVTNRYR